MLLSEVVVSLFSSSVFHLLLARSCPSSDPLPVDPRLRSCHPSWNTYSLERKAAVREGDIERELDLLARRSRAQFSPWHRCCDRGGTCPAIHVMLSFVRCWKGTRRCQALLLRCVFFHFVILYPICLHPCPPIGRLCHQFRVIAVQ